MCARLVVPATGAHLGMLRANDHLVAGKSSGVRVAHHAGGQQPWPRARLSRRLVSLPTRSDGRRAADSGQNQEDCRGKDQGDCETLCNITLPLLAQAFGGETALKVFHFLIEYKNSWNAAGFPTPMIDAAIVRRFNNMLGGRVVLMLCGGAPLSADTQAFARAVFGVYLSQGYAATECCGVG